MVGSIWDRLTEINIGCICNQVAYVLPDFTTCINSFISHPNVSPPYVLNGSARSTEKKGKGGGEMHEGGNRGKG
jgi:hypothetical protein